MPPGNPPYPPPGTGYYPPPAPKTNVWAIVSLISGLFGCLGVPISVISGVVGLNKAREGQGGRALAIAGLVLSALWLVVVAGVGLYYLAQYLVTDKDGATMAGRSPASYFKIGDCLAEIPRTRQDVTVVDCDKPHAAEVFAIFMLPDGDFPGQATIEEYKNRCEEELTTYSPTPEKDTAVGVMKRYPDENSWELGDRSVTCIAAMNPPRTGSIKG